MHDERLDQLSERQHEVIARRQTRALGLSRSAAYRLGHRNTGWEALTHRVLRRVGSPRTDAQQLMAAVLDTAHDAVVSHVSAARWWGHNGCTLRPFVLTTTDRSRRETPLGLVHRATSLSEEWTTRLDGIPIVRPEMLAMQLFDVCRYPRAERLVEWLWSQHLLSGPSIHQFVDEHGERGRSGTAGLRQYLRTRPVGYAPAASGLESRAMHLFEDAELPMRRHADLGAGSWTGRVDFLHVDPSDGGRDPERALSHCSRRHDRGRPPTEAVGRRWLRGRRAHRRRRLDASLAGRAENRARDRPRYRRADENSGATDVTPCHRL